MKCLTISLILAVCVFLPGCESTPAANFTPVMDTASGLNEQNRENAEQTGDTETIELTEQADEVVESIVEAVEQDEDGEITIMEMEGIISRLLPGDGNSALRKYTLALLSSSNAKVMAEGGPGIPWGTIAAAVASGLVFRKVSPYLLPINGNAIGGLGGVLLDVFLQSQSTREKVAAKKAP